MRAMILLASLPLIGVMLAPVSAAPATLPDLTVPASVQCVEGGSVPLKVSRSGNKSTTATFGYATADGTATAPGDYAAMSGQQSVRKNTVSYTFTILCGTDDQTFKGDRQFTFTITPIKGATASRPTTVVTVKENDPDQPPVVCPDGTTVPAGQTCPVPPPSADLSIGEKVKATAACQSSMNPADFLKVDAIYYVSGFGGMNTIEQLNNGQFVPAGTKDLVTLEDRVTRWGDGWFAYFVPASCVQAV